jgi:hypothetical protein
VSSLALAAASAHEYAGCWNDGSRLATVESLVDQGTLAIDRSVFVQVPDAHEGAAGSPYPPDDLLLCRNGTGDKLLIAGHFYSDKSPVPAVLMAGLYKAMQWATGLKARATPAHFCYLMTLATSGLAYVLAVWCVFRLAWVQHLPIAQCFLLAASLGLASVALPYCRHVNNHVLLLAVSAGIMLQVARWSGRADDGSRGWPGVAALGALAGLGYTIDLGAGPILFICTLGIVVYRCRRWQAAAIFCLAAVPWLALHHTLNYSVGGTWKPANAVPEYFQWPGCSFDARNMTGTWNHDSITHFLLYAAGLLAGKRGFLGHNLPLFLAVAAAAWLLRQRVRDTPEVVFALCWCGGTWLAYALTSTNSSGVCCSVRWFVPLLAPAYYLLAVLLRHAPAYCQDLAILSAWGAILGGLMWWKGPWMQHMVPYFWQIQAAALLTWLTWAIVRTRRQAAMGSPATPTPEQWPKAA